jgi:hypothetical protein
MGPWRSCTPALPCARCSASTVLLDSGTLPGDDAPLVDVLPKSVPATTSSAMGRASAQLLVTVSSAAGPGASSSSGAGAVQGRARLHGTIAGVAVCHRRQGFGRAVAELKADLQASLRARLDLLVEDALSWGEEAAAAATPGEGAQKQPQVG